MLVGAGNENTMLIGITDADIEALQKGLTLTFEGCRMLVANIVIAHSATKESLIQTLRSAGVEIDSEMEKKYKAGKRTDKPRNVS